MFGEPLSCPCFSKKICFCVDVGPSTIPRYARTLEAKSGSIDMLSLIISNDVHTAMSIGKETFL